MLCCCCCLIKVHVDKHLPKLAQRENALCRMFAGRYYHPIPVLPFSSSHLQHNGVCSYGEIWSTTRTNNDKCSPRLISTPQKPSPQTIMCFCSLCTYIQEWLQWALLFLFLKEMYRNRRLAALFQTQWCVTRSDSFSGPELWDGAAPRPKKIKHVRGRGWMLSDRFMK